MEADRYGDGEFSTLEMVVEQKKGIALNDAAAADEEEELVVEDGVPCR